MSRALLILSLVLAFAVRTFAATLVLTPARDNTIYGSGDAELSNGGGQGLFVGRNGQIPPRVLRGLLSFNLSGQIPAGSLITAATLTLTITTPRNDTVTVELHRLLADWGEGNTIASRGGGGGGPAAPGQATWNARVLGSAAWATPGGDFASAVSASKVVSGISGGTAISSAGMVADLQAWVDNPAANFGWIMVAQNEASLAVRFSSREGFAPPALQVTFTAPSTAPAFTSASTATFALNQPNAFAVTASGSPAPGFSVSSGSLPTWATLDAASGNLTGLPPSLTGAPFLFTLKAANGVAPDATQVFTLNVVARHSADCSPANGQISAAELLRVIELYNVRNGSLRTGRYAVADTATLDGFQPDPATANSAAVTLARYHTADVNQDGKLNLVELTRVVELYQYRTGTTRTGDYHVQPGTEDGFAPGL